MGYDGRMTTNPPGSTHTDLEREQFAALTDQGKAYYVDLRSTRGYTHNDALASARYSYGRRRT